MIRGCIGRGGSGKSLYTVSRLHRLFMGVKGGEGRDIVSNTPLIDLRVKRILAPNGLIMWVPVDSAMFGHSWAVGYITKFDHIYDISEAEVFIDELGTWCPSSSWKEMPDSVRQFIAQDRREGVNVWWTHRSDRVVIDIRENTAELVKNIRFGPLVVSTCSDPQAPDEKPVRKFTIVTSKIYDLYDTMARVGNAKGEGYGQGKRRLYGGRDSGFFWVANLPTLREGEFLPAKIRLRPEQVQCLRRKFGFSALGVHREQFGNFVRYFRGEQLSPMLVQVADSPDLLKDRGIAW